MRNSAFIASDNKIGPGGPSEPLAVFCAVDQLRQVDALVERDTLSLFCVSWEDMGKRGRKLLDVGDLNSVFELFSLGASLGEVGDKAAKPAAVDVPGMNRYRHAAVSKRNFRKFHPGDVPSSLSGTPSSFSVVCL